MVDGVGMVAGIIGVEGAIQDLGISILMPSINRIVIAEVIGEELVVDVEDIKATFHLLVKGIFETQRHVHIAFNGAMIGQLVTLSNNI